MKTRLFIVLVLLAFAIPVVEAQQLDPVPGAIGQVNLDSLTSSIRDLSGETGTIIAGRADTLTSRAAGSTDNQSAAGYLAQKLSSFGLSAVFQPYSVTGTNVYAVQTGADYPGIAYIVCAHYDDRPSTGVAPGADDNASGTAVVLEAARILSRYRTAYTIICALWDEEETGLVGSKYFANLASGRRDSILGVLNLDMLGWDSNDDSLLEIHTNSTARSIELADTIFLMNQRYGLGTKPTILNPGTSASDHSSFWQKGYSAVLLIEAYFSGDFNSHYHTSTDRLQFFNQSFYHRASKLAVGTMAFLAGIKGALSVESTSMVPGTYALYQNYPNPFNPTTTVKFSVSSRRDLVRIADGQIPNSRFQTSQYGSRSGIGDVETVSLMVYDVLGRQVATLLNERIDAGVYEVKFDGSGLASGVYFCQMRAGQFMETRKMMLAR